MDSLIQVSQPSEELVGSLSSCAPLHSIIIYVYHPFILGRFLSLPLTGRLLSLQFLREGPQQAHKVLVSVS
jgi:hypothetical protein